MKKIFLIVMLAMTSITFYFLCVWEPTERESKGVTAVETQKDKDSSAVRENKEEAMPTEQGKIEIEQEKTEGRAKEIKENIKKLSKEEREKLYGLLEKLSTTDMLLVTKALERGNMVEAEGIISKRLLKEDSKKIFEIFEKVKMKDKKE